LRCCKSCGTRRDRKPEGPFTDSSRARHYAILNSLKASSLACHRERRMVGLSRFELLTPRLSSVCSNQLSYRPQGVYSSPCQRPPASPRLAPVLSKLDRTCNPSCTRSIIFKRLFRLRCRRQRRRGFGHSRKEVIQPQVLLQLPCYDFTPITDHTLGACLPCGLAQRLLVQPAFVM
jgi:hypothetical protein